MSAVPLPLMLKLLVACSVVVFWMKPLAACPSNCEALRLLIAYGVEVIGCRGDSGANDPTPVGLTDISRKRGWPSKQVGQLQPEQFTKSSETVKMPLVTTKSVTGCVVPCCEPAPSKSL